MALSRHERTKHKIDPNPLELIEKVVAANDWPFDRTSDREIAVEVAGRWCDYRMFFSWRDDVDALRAALVELHGRFTNGGLSDVQLSPRWRHSVARSTRVEETAELLRSLA